MLNFHITVSREPYSAKTGASQLLPCTAVEPVYPAYFCGCFEFDLVVFWFYTFSLFFCLCFVYETRLVCLGGWGERVLDALSIFVCFVCLFLITHNIACRISGDRGGCVSILPQARGILFLPLFGLPFAIRIISSGYLLSSFFFLSFSFLCCLSFIFSAGTWVAGVRLLSQLSYPVYTMAWGCIVYLLPLLHYDVPGTWYVRSISVVVL